MFDTIGVPELLIILVIVALVFGVGRVSSLGKELGTAVSEFRKGLRSDDQPEQVANSANEFH
jgi:sec-independent protein translocase protein TatA